MRERKRRVESFAFYDSTGIEKHLASMAAKGWQLEKITSWFWRYRRCEPQRLRYAVTYFPGASEFDPAPGPDQQTYLDYCEEAGWTPVARWAQMQIFCTADEDAAPIETDETVRLRTVRRAMRKNFLPGSIALALIALLQIVMRLWSAAHDRLAGLVDLLSDSADLGSLFLWVLVIGASLVNLVGYGAWYRRSRREVEAGGACVPVKGTYRRVSQALLAVTLVALILWLMELADRRMGTVALLSMGCAALLLLAVMGVKHAMKSMGASRRASMAATWAAAFLGAFLLTGGMTFLILHMDLGPGRKPAETYTTEYPGGHTMTWDIYHDPIPLRVEDLTETDYAHYSCEWEAQSSPFLGKYVGGQNAFPDGEDAPELRYVIVDVKWPVLYEWCVEQYLRQYDQWYEEREYRRETPPEGADWMYRLYSGGEAADEYLLGSGARVIEVHFYGWEPTAEQLAVTAARLARAAL